jgi:hypothetical protein
MSSRDLIERLSARGFTIDLALRNNLLLLYTLFDEGTTKQFWEQQDLSEYINDTAEADYLKNILIALSPLGDINVINYSIILYSLSYQEIKNFYRYLFIEWKKIEHLQNFKAFPVTPNELSNYSHTDLRTLWCNFMDTLFNREQIYLYFFINRLTYYFIPFKN